MQLFATFLVAASLIASILAVPCVVQRNTADASNSIFTGSYDGQGTWFHPGLGACGITNQDSDHIVAVAPVFFQGNNGDSNDSAVCGKQITAQYQGKTVTVTVTDECPSCIESHLDLSPAAFSVLADLSVGVIHLEWSWV